MEFLPQQNRRNEGDAVPEAGAILATGKRVVIIGGGDTGADCLGTSHRQGALSVTQFELLPKPPDERSPSTPWPLWPMQLRVESSHEEGGASRLERIHRELHRRRARPREAVARHARRPAAQLRAAARQRSSRWMPTWCCWPWASWGP